MHPQERAPTCQAQQVTMPHVMHMGHEEKGTCLRGSPYFPKTLLNPRKPLLPQKALLQTSYCTTASEDHERWGQACLSLTPNCVPHSSPRCLSLQADLSSPSTPLPKQPCRRWGRPWKGPGTDANMSLTHISCRTDWGRSGGALKVDEGSFSWAWEETAPWDAEQG